jgi:hypothetical protein
MIEQDLAKIKDIREIVKAVIEEDRAQRASDEFYINRKALYDTHQRTVSILSSIDAISSVIGRTIVYSFIVGAASLIIWAMGRVK